MRHWWLYPSLAVTLWAGASETDESASVHAQSPGPRAYECGGDPYSARLGQCLISVLKLAPPSTAQRSREFMIRHDGGAAPDRLRAWLGGPEPSGTAQPRAFLLAPPAATLISLKLPPHAGNAAVHLWIEADFGPDCRGRAAFELDPSAERTPITNGEEV